MSEGSVHGFHHEPTAPSPVHWTANTLEEAIAELNDAARQAFYTAASKRTIKRGTWNGCAFNAAGEEVGQVVRSTVTAAKAFGVSPTVVSNFISAWDSSTSRFKTDEEATAFLIKCIDEAGLHKDAIEEEKLKQTGSFSTGYKRLKKVFRVTVYESLETKMKKFEEQFENDTVPHTDLAEQLLCSVG